MFREHSVPWHLCSDFIVVLGIGYGVTYCTSIYEGKEIPSTTIKVNSAGYDLTGHLRQMLSEKYPSVLRMVPHSIIKDMKQKHCFVATSYHEALKQNANSYRKYKLPDGQCIRISNERFKVCEPLFGGFMNLNHEVMADDNRMLFKGDNAAFNDSGVQNMIHQSIGAVPLDQMHPELYSNIVVSGGSTLFKGFVNRLKGEMNRLTDHDVTIIANEKRKYLAWIGGSIISSMQNFQDNFISRGEYEEEGPAVVHRKCAQ